MAHFRHLLRVEHLVFIFFAVLVCSGAEAAALPAWVTAPPSDSSMVMYGVGDGDDREAAKAAALAAIAGTLMTKVQSSTSVDQHQNDAGFSEQIRVTVQTKVKDTALSSYKVVDAQRVSRRWWVLS